MTSDVGSPIADRDATISFDNLPFYDDWTAYEPCQRPSVRPKNEEEFTVNYNTIWVLGRLRKPPRNRKSDDLSLIGTIPLDILFEILEYAHPIDLYHLTRTNKAYRALLWSRASVSLWRITFQRHPDIVRCPSNIPEPRWANLLFGAFDCEFCNGKLAFPFSCVGRRLCAECCEEMFIQRGSLQGYEWNHLIWSLALPCQSIIGKGSSFPPIGVRYWKSDVQKIASVISCHEFAIKQELSNAEEKFEQYKTGRKLEVALAIAHNHLCSIWHNNLTLNINQAEDNRHRKLIANIKNRLARVGHIQEDIDDAEFPAELLRPSYCRLTNSRWNKLKFQLTEPVLEARAQRLENEHYLAVKAREKVVKSVYDKYRRLTLPSAWIYHPPAYAVYDMPPFAALINAPSDDELSEDDCKEALVELPQLIIEWRREKLNQLASLLPCTTSDTSQELRQPNMLDLDRATSVFTCLGSIGTVQLGKCLIGYDGAGPHLRCGALRTHWNRRLHFSRRGYDAAASLVALMRLDPNHTLARDLDRLNPRFICLNCPMESCRGFEGRRVLWWRECVLHFIENERTHQVPAWALLTPEGVADVKRREDLDPSMYSPFWACNHCPIHFNAMVKHRKALKHARTVHNIDHPIVNLDIINLDLESTLKRRRRVILAQSDPAEYSCKKCRQYRRRRLYSRQGITDHLRGKHGIEHPNANDHWLKVETILRVTPVPTISAPPDV